MGEKALSFFEEADRHGGLTFKIKLATVVKMTSSEAAAANDGDDLIDRLRTALTQLKAGGGGAGAAPQERLVDTADARSLRQHISVYLDLMSQRALFPGDVKATVHRLNESAANTLQIARVSVWFIDEDQSKIICADLYERVGQTHSSGTELFRKDFPDYFVALATERTIAAHDAHTDPRTSCFSKPYLAPLGINSMLDVPIWVAGKLVGVVCHEHQGPPRTWSSDEERFGYLMANFVSLAMERTAN